VWTGVGCANVKDYELAGVTLKAHSVGGIETCIHLPEHKLAFDIGKCPEHVVPRELILFTHGHMDHMGGLAYHASTRALRNMRPATYVMPPEYVPRAAALFEAWRALDHSEMPGELRGMQPGERLELHATRFIEPFETFHTAPSMGYALWSKRRKLKPQYAGLPGIEIKQLRASGVEVTEELLAPEVAYCGDTMIEVVERHAVVRRAKLLILECTFIDDRIDRNEARSRGHLHLDEIAERAELFENDAILLHHFSARFSRAQIKAEIRERLPAGLRERVTPLLAGFH